MIHYEDMCVSCPKEMGCLGDACPNMHVPVFICDKCEEQVDKLYELDGEILCLDCLLETVGAKEVKWA